MAQHTETEPAAAPTRADLVALIDWLALPYAFDPDFIVADEPQAPYIQTGYRERLKATWEHVVGTKGPSNRPVAAARCQTCGMIQFVPVEEGSPDGT